jgi:pimeloyl-ACP methyl ester carboxylesterase
MPLMRPKDLGRITVPTTLVWSDDDVALGRRMAELTAEYVNAPYELVEVAGSHWLLDEQPDVVADAIIKRARSAG